MVMQCSKETSAESDIAAKHEIGRMEGSGSARLEAIELSVSHIVIGRNLLSATTHDLQLDISGGYKLCIYKTVGWESVVGRGTGRSRCASLCLLPKRGGRG